MKKIACILALVCMLLVGATSCNKGVEFDINFVVNGQTYGSVTTGGNEVITLPNDPVKEGCTFKGWYWDEGVWREPFTANSLMNVPLTKNMSVYAYFVENGSTNETVSLKFNTMGGSSIEMQTVTKGSTAIEPDIPILDGYVFCGWYYSSDYKTEFSFDEAITENITIYAKWSQVGTSLIVDDFEDLLEVEQNNSFYDIFVENETGRVYLVYKLGTLKNSIIARVSSHSIYNRGGVTLSWDTCDSHEESISKGIEETLSTAFTTEIGVEVGGGTPVSASVSLSYTVSASLSHSYSQTCSIMTSASNGGTVSLDGFEKDRHYAMFVVGDQNVYQYFVFDSNGNFESTAITAAEISSSLRVLSSVDGNFEYKNIGLLEPLETTDFSLVFASGDGTNENPYQIKSLEQLFAVGLNPSANYKLIDDIDLKEFDKWHTIGSTEDNAFSGVFDGGNKTIKNLNISLGGKAINENEVDGSIFGYVSGEIKNLNIDNISWKITENHTGSGWLYAGVLCGKLTGTVSNIKATNCALETLRDQSYGGIIVGYALGGTINDIEVKESTIYSQGDAGFVAGCLESGSTNNCTVSSCELKHFAIYVNRSNGGIVGYANEAIVKDCRVEKTTFNLVGSTDAMHTYFFGGHTNCKLRPTMGYIIGSARSTELNIDGHTAVDNIVECNQYDAGFVTNSGANESLYWFRYYDGKVGIEL